MTASQMCIQRYIALVAIIPIVKVSCHLRTCTSHAHALLHAHEGWMMSQMQLVLYFIGCFHRSEACIMSGNHLLMWAIDCLGINQSRVL